MKLYSNEIVFKGHPDKVCDQISDALLDEYLRGDKQSRCGIEVAGGKGKIFITGEVTSNAKVNVKKVVKDVLKDVGYKGHYKIINNLGKQSHDIALGTNESKGGAGDQGMMFGFATDETSKFLPKAQVILQEFAANYEKHRKYLGDELGLKSDGKAQITGYYDSNFNLIKIKDFLINYQNDENPEHRKKNDAYLKALATTICSKYGVKVERFLINPTGRFCIGGFEGDAGLTGRKIVVDSYQSFANVGGGAFSGKDPTKVDRSGAYKAREIAKDYLKRYKLHWCEVQLSYAIGIDQPLAIYITSDKGAIEPDPRLYVECTPRNIIKDLNLLEPKYRFKAQYGHFTK